MLNASKVVLKLIAMQETCPMQETQAGHKEAIVYCMVSRTVFQPKKLEYNAMPVYPGGVPATHLRMCSL